MKLYTLEEVKKMRKSFTEILKRNNVSLCEAENYAYYPEPIEVELTGRIIPDLVNDKLVKDEVNPLLPE